MGGMRRWVAAIVLALTPLATASAGWWDDLDKGEPVRLSDVTSKPDGWKGKVVTFACIYHKFDGVYQPYFTSFNAVRFEPINFIRAATPRWMPRGSIRETSGFAGGNGLAVLAS